ncbi:Type IV pilus assembly protein PilM [Ectothiorhodosinus mongolicus]|uniref:Type IV pilus assembly protein PilM n=1 Tax=Ectothiorhodosinus mongolicus TaxID=233100 RepID=A0A1R3VUR1_9GAMM|nr:pilus assembly protein PilM [Ectothiorhodosinus mongolicus]ULX56867.1 hypothetical protein CKX93_03600 [Ectothiorhodosinus mongolicus]SIT68726.1 Type IV pilus assembly protein PilM [Ectothiorhodosinus mongolicus]
MRTLWKKKRTQVGIDLERNHLRLALIGKYPQGNELIDQCEWELDDNNSLLSGGNDALIAAFTEVRRYLGRSVRDGVLGLPAHDYACHDAAIPRGLPEAQLKRLIREEAAAYLPYPLDEAELRYHPSHQPSMGSSQQRYLFWAVRRDRLALIQAAARQAGLRLSCIEARAHGLYRACRPTGPASATLIACVEPTQLQLWEIGQGELRYQEVSLDLADASPLAWLGSISEAMNLLLRSARTTPICLTGRIASPELQEHLQKTLPSPCRLWRGPSHGLMAEKSKPIDPAYAAAIGLALREPS